MKALSSEQKPQFFLPYQDHESDTFLKCLNTSLKSVLLVDKYGKGVLKLKQVQSRFSLVFTDEEWYYFKYSPYFKGTLLLLLATANR